MKSKNLLLVLSSLFLVGCGGRGETADAVKDGVRVAYGLTGGNLIRAEINVKDGKVAAAHFGEFQVGTSVLATANVAEASDAVFTIAGKYGNSYVAKYLNFNGDVYAGTYDAEAKTVTFKKDNTDLDAKIGALTAQDELASLYHTLENNFVYGSDAEGNDLGLTKQLNKASADSKYWPTKEGVLGWKGNTAKIEAALVGKDLSKDTVDKTASGATTGSFQTYIDLATKAFKGESLATVHYSRDMIEGREKNGHSMCFAQIELHFGADKKVKKAFINETDQFMTLAAKLTDEEAALFADDEKLTVSTTVYAKNLSVAGELFTGSVLETAYQKEALGFSNAAVTAAKFTNSLDYFGSTLELAQSYYHAAMLHNINKVKADGTVVAPGTRGNRTATKAEKDNGYWNITDGSKEVVNNSRWKWNIAKVEAALVGLDLSADIAATKGDDNFWSFGTVSTGASMTEAETFLALAKVAFSYLA
ncbi:MAG: hypothetical protein SPJ51_00195 [Candidatus Enterosoma sp.]|nr:hypothetical protein [bacterium]MDY5909225.1 hypothetical protein [Candidatus Enterosoma sp.]